MVSTVLTDPQGQVLRHRCAGKTVQETADALATSVTNVMGQRSNLWTRLGGRSFNEICRLADLGVEPEPTVSASLIRRHPYRPVTSTWLCVNPADPNLASLPMQEDQAPARGATRVRPAMRILPLDTAPEPRHDAFRWNDAGIVHDPSWWAYGSPRRLGGRSIKRISTRMDDQQRLAKRQGAITRLQSQLHAIERIQRAHPGETDLLVPAIAAREINQVLFSMSVAIGGMERIRQIMIPNDAILPPSRFRTSPDEMVPLTTVLVAARAALRALGADS